MPQWINAKAQQPFCTVLVFRPSARNAEQIGTTKYDHHMQRWSNEHLHRVSHWMALPDAPDTNPDWQQVSIPPAASGTYLAYRPNAPATNECATVEYDATRNKWGGKFAVSHYMALPDAPVITPKRSQKQAA